jgi:hypothetical protein
MAYVAPKAAPVLTVREGIVAEIPKGSESYALSSTSSVPSAAPAKPGMKQAAKTKVAKASKKKAPEQQFAQGGWQQNQPFGGGWDQRQNRAENRGGWDQPQRSGRNASNSNRNGGGGRYAMSGQQTFFSPFGTIR